jgi:hypothetical protein
MPFTFWRRRNYGRFQNVDKKISFAVQIRHIFAMVPWHLGPVLKHNFLYFYFFAKETFQNLNQPLSLSRKILHRFNF